MLLFFVGVTVGGYGTLIGAGGGFLLMPLLLVVFPDKSAAALASLSLSIVALNAFSGALAYAWQRRIEFRLAGVLAVVTVPGSMLGAATTRYIPRTIFEAVFGFTLLVMGVMLVRRPLAGIGTQLDTAAARGAADARRFRLGLLLSMTVGWLAGVLGIGGSPPQVVVLTHVMRIPVARAMPTIQFLVMLSALGAVGVHVAAGVFDVSLTSFVSLGAGAMIGAQIGAVISSRLSGAVLVRLLAGALLIIGGGLLLKAAI